jgi:hypothetical protein
MSSTISRQPELPFVFVGSSTPGLTVARAVQQQLQSSWKVARVHIWNEIVDNLSQGILESLIRNLDTYDFGVLILTPDDFIESGGVQQRAARDNVLLEFGLCVGRLSRERTFLLVADDPGLRIASDLRGVIYASFTMESEYGELLSAVGPACSTIAASIQRAGKLTELNRLAKTVKDQQIRVDEQQQLVEQQQKMIDELVKYAMSASIFRHLCGITLLKDYKYFHNDGNRREFYFLRDAGYIKPKHDGFIEFYEGLNATNIADVAEATPIGRLCVKLRQSEIPPQMLQDINNLRIAPSDL